MAYSVITLSLLLHPNCSLLFVIPVVFESTISEYRAALGFGWKTEGKYKLDSFKITIEKVEPSPKSRFSCSVFSEVEQVE